MQSSFVGSGNLGADPTLRLVKVDGEDRAVCNMRVNFDRRRPSKDGKGWEDAGSFWASVSVWGRQAELVEKILLKGARVVVSGEIYQHEWVDENEVDRVEMRITAESVSLDLLCVETVQYRAKSSADKEAA